MEPPVLERLKAIDDLPTLPSVALEVLSLAHSSWPNASTGTPPWPRRS